MNAARTTGLTDHRLKSVESQLSDVRASIAGIEETMRAGFGDMNTRMERLIEIETKQRGFEDSLNAAHDKLRGYDADRRTSEQTLSSVHSSLTMISQELPKLTAAMNGEGGLITQVALLKDKVAAQRWINRSLIAFAGSVSLSSVGWVVVQVLTKVFP